MCEETRQHGSEGRAALQCAALTRRAWEAFIRHAQTGGDIERLAVSAEQRMRYCYAIPLFRRLKESGSSYNASRYLAELMEKQGRAEEAMDLWRSLYVDPKVNGYESARMEDLEKQPAGAEAAIKFWRARVDGGDSYANFHIANILKEQGRPDEAIEILKPLADTGHPSAHSHLADILAEGGRLAEAVDVLKAAPADWYATWRLVDILAELERTEELGTRASEGDSHAAQRLAEILERQGRGDEAVSILRAHPDVAIQPE